MVVLGFEPYRLNLECHKKCGKVPYVQSSIIMQNAFSEPKFRIH